MENPLELTMVLIWLSGIGAVMAVNWVLAKLAESWPVWGNLPRPAKFLIPPVVAVLIALGANELLKLPDLIASVQPYWTIIVTVVLGYFGSQSGHTSAKTANQPAVLIMARAVTDKTGEAPIDLLAPKHKE